MCGNLRFCTQNISFFCPTGGGRNRICVEIYRFARQTLRFSFPQEAGGGKWISQNRVWHGKNDVLMLPQEAGGAECGLHESFRYVKRGVFVKFTANSRQWSEVRGPHPYIFGQRSSPSSPRHATWYIALVQLSKLISFPGQVMSPLLRRWWWLGCASCACFLKAW